MRTRVRKRGIRGMGPGMQGNWWKCGELENEGNHGCDDREWEEKPGNHSRNAGNWGKYMGIRAEMRPTGNGK